MDAKLIRASLRRLLQMEKIKRTMMLMIARPKPSLFVSAAKTEKRHARSKSGGMMDDGWWMMVPLPGSPLPSDGRGVKGEGELFPLLSSSHFTRKKMLAP